jgi:hypothetical protein
LIVWLLRNSRSAISPLARPWAIKLRISTSRWVRPSGGPVGPAGADPEAAGVPPVAAAGDVPADAAASSDLGSHRKIGPLFLYRPVTHGNGLLVELAGVVAGLLCGLVITALMRVYRSPKTGKPVSAAGLPYAIALTLIVAARTAFSVGAVRWFPAQIAQWAAVHQVTGAAITDGLIFMAIARVLVRTAGLAARATRLPSAPLATITTA